MWFFGARGAVVPGCLVLVVVLAPRLCALVRGAGGVFFCFTLPNARGAFVPGCLGMVLFVGALPK